MAPPEYYSSGLSAASKQKLAQFREALGADLPDRYTNTTLTRFLRARANDIEKAKAMVQSDIAWRKELGILDSRKFCAEFEQSVWYKSMKGNWPWKFHGYDLEGSMVILERIGLVDPKSIQDAVPFSHQRWWHIYLMEFMEIVKQEHEDQGKPLPFDGAITLIQDLRGLGLKHCNHATYDVLRMIAKMDSDHYPECLKRFIIVKAPKIFSTIWGSIKGMLDPLTTAKIQVIKEDKVEAVMSQFIPTYSIPAFLGGHCQCGPNGGDCCPSGGELKAQHLLKLTVDARGTKEVVVPVPTDGLLQWTFCCNSNVSLKIVQKRAPKEGMDPEDVVLVDLDKMSGEAGNLEVTPGEVRLIFNNQFSMLTAKHLCYSATFTPPRTIDRNISEAVSETLTAMKLLKAGSRLSADSVLPKQSSLRSAHHNQALKCMSEMTLSSPIEVDKRQTLRNSTPSVV